ncbi:MAG TPA: nuclear transport factor 2 family protein [Ohtaekwangia sp.]|uniref:nuclear transport factor 2 family protein n=1 Tax=Ohtaekwangia sp. TaxID=2066019 RepID=UPI002F92D125
MKTVLIFITLLMSITTTTLAQTAEEKEVAAAVEALRKAMVDSDKAALEKLAANELTYGHSAGKIEDKALFVDNLTNGNSDFVTIDLTDQTIRIVGNTALVRHTLTADTNDGGKPGKVKLGVLQVWQKQTGGGWKLLARQSFKFPQ